VTGQGGTGEDLTLLKVNLTPAARSALEKVAALTDSGLTDTVNRALLLFSEVADIAANHEGAYWSVYPDFDARGAVWLLVTRDRPKKRRWPW
jgi:hypothetical protein